VLFTTYQRGKPQVSRSIERGTMRSPASSGMQISRRKDPAYVRRESLGAEEKTSRTRDIHSKAFTPRAHPRGPVPILDRVNVTSYRF